MLGVVALKSGPQNTFMITVEKHNHHYVPQGYLRGFAIVDEKSLLWEYDKEGGTVSKSPKSVRKVCSRRDHNRLVHKDGSPDPNTLEDALCKHIESPALRIIKQLCPKKGQGEVCIPETERECLSLFSSLLLTRNPDFRDGMEEMERRVLDGFLQFNIKEMKKTGEMPENEDMRVVVHPRASIKAMMEAAAMGSRALLAKKWILLLPAHGMTFVTSDYPAVMGFSGPPSALVGPFHPSSEMIVPLRKDLGLVCVPEAPRTDGMLDVIVLSQEYMARFNRRIIEAALRFVYAPEKSQELLQMVKESRGMAQGIEVS